MGYQVRQYSLDELHRISLPGAVVPSLFWALPVGRWDQRELDALWNYFTRHNSNCFDFGLLLVESPAGGQESSPGNLQGVGAILNELLPSGTDRYIDTRRAAVSPRQLLVLSGAYPQPGWGVLIPVPESQSSVRAVSGVVDAAVERLGHDDDTEAAKRSIRDAGRHFHKWKELNEFHPKSTIASEVLENAKNAERAASALEKLKGSLATANPETVSTPLIELINALDNSFWAELAEAVTRLRELRKSSMTSAAILAPSTEYFAHEVEPRLAAIKVDPKEKERILRECRDKTASRAIRRALELDAMTPPSDARPLRERAVVFRDSALESLAVELGALNAVVQGRLAESRIAIAASKARLEHALGEWRAGLSAARMDFHRSLAQAADVQWRIGPRLLVAFESVAVESGLSPLTIPWDPPRMIGWKLQVCHGAVTLHDLQQAAKELGFEAPTNPATSEDGIESLVDGSYFTDYIHFMASSKLGDSPRIVTQRLLASLLRPTELRRLLGTKAEDAGAGTDRQAVANAVLAHMGWKVDATRRKISLAEWPVRLKISPNAPVVSRTAVEMRISLESLCKDVLDIINYRLGYSEQELWEALRERAPDYQPASHRRAWVEEVGALTPGSAALLISALAPLAFPDVEHSIKAWVAALQVLGSHLNDPTHDRDCEDAQVFPQQLAEEIETFLTRCHAVLGELPWHLSPSFVHGAQPKVICGEAWNHGQAVPRLLRVIASSDVPARQEIVLWNTNGTNPVIADPVFLTRGTRTD